MFVILYKGGGWTSYVKRRREIDYSQSHMSCVFGSLIRFHTCVVSSILIHTLPPPQNFHWPVFDPNFPADVWRRAQRYFKGWKQIEIGACDHQQWPQNICGKKTIALAGRLFLPKTLNFKISLMRHHCFGWKFCAIDISLQWDNIAFSGGIEFWKLGLRIWLY